MLNFQTQTFESTGADSVSAEAEDDSGMMLMLMDELAHGVVVITRSGRVEYTNRAARAELSRSRFLVMSQQVLHSCDTNNARVLEDAMGRAAQGKRSLIALTGDTGGLQVAVVPFRGLPGAPNQRFALYFARPAVYESQMFTLYARSRGLTHTEQTVLSVLCEGYSTPEIATQLGVAVSTIRTHVRNLCFKTASSGVRELVNQVAVLPPVGPTLAQGQVH